MSISPHILPPRQCSKVWDVENAQQVHELVSFREATPSALATVPSPRLDSAEGPLKSHRPVLAVGRSSSEALRGHADAPADFHSPSDGLSAVGSVFFYSFPACRYVHTLEFHSVREAFP